MTPTLKEIIDYLRKKDPGLNKAELERFSLAIQEYLKDRELGTEKSFIKCGGCIHMGYFKGDPRWDQFCEPCHVIGSNYKTTC